MQPPVPCNSFIPFGPSANWGQAFIAGAYKVSESTWDGLARLIIDRDLSLEGSYVRFGANVQNFRREYRRRRP